MSVIDNVKSLLGLPEESEQLKTIISLTESRLKALLAVDVVPQELEYIEVEVAVSALTASVQRVPRLTPLRVNPGRLVITTLQPLTMISRRGDPSKKSSPKAK